MSDIPQARERLEAMKDAMIEGGLVEYADEVREVLGLMVRERHKRRAATQSTPMTCQLADEIRDYARWNREASAQQIANVFGVNPGRVSEALAGGWRE